MLASFPKALCLFFKSEQFQLIDMPVQVGASVDKHGHVKHAHTRIQKVRVEKPAAPQQASMFDDAPAAPVKKANKLDTFIRKHGGLASLAHVMAGLTEGQQQRIFEEMGKLSGQTAVEVSAMFDHITPEAPAQDDLFSQPAKETNESQAVKPQQARKEEPQQGGSTASTAKPAESAEPGATDKKTELSARAKQAVDILRDGGVFRKQLETQYRGGEKFETHLIDSNGAVVAGLGVKTRMELQDAGMLESVPDVIKTSAYREEWRLRGEFGPKEGDHKTENGVDYVLRGGRWHLAAEKEKAEYRYAMVNRPVGIGTAPKEGLIRAEDRPAKDSDHYQHARNGVAVFNRKLTDAETKQFEMALMADGQDRDAVAQAVADDMAEYADQYVEMSENATEDFDQIVLQRIKATSKGYPPSVGSIGKFAGLVADKLKTATEPKIEPEIAQNVQKEPLKLDYDGFRAEYEKLFNQMNKYSSNEVGSQVFAEKMAKLSDDYPEFMDRFDRNDGEIHNLKKIQAISDRQGLDLDVDGMASERLRGSGRLPEVKYEYVPGKPFEVRPVHDATLPFGVQAGISKQARRDLNAKGAAIVNRGGAITEADKAVLRQYSGNGGCGDSLNEFYTLPAVADAMWQVAQSLGVKGNVFEPSCGPGVFLHTAPGDSRVTGVEMDPVSAKIAKALHGDRHELANASLERFATQDDRQFDGVLGNVPFGLRGSLIKDDKPKLKTADAYFCDTSMDKCKAGGIVGLIVPTGIMDSRTNRKLRESMLRKGQFLGAQRMPNTAFEHSHTEVTTDVIWFRKYPDDVAGALSSPAITQDHLKAMGVWDDDYLAGNYFTGRGAANVLGTMGEGWRAKAGMGADITVEGSMRDVPQAIAAFKPEPGTPIPSVTDILSAVGDDEKTREKVLGAALARPYADKSKVGDTKMMDGVAYVLQGKPPRWHRVDEVIASPALTQGQELAGRIEALMGGAEMDRPKLEADLKLWVLAHGLPSKHKDILLGAQHDKTLYRLIGAVNGQGEFSDAVTGTAAKAHQGNFEATVQSLLNDHETAAVRSIAKSAGIDDDEATDQLYGSNKYAIDPVTGEWTTRDIYLSGGLWPKLDAAKQALTGELAPELRKKIEQQAAMLNEAIAPVSLEEAFIQVNSAFLPTTMLSAFLTWRNHEAPDANKWTKELPATVVTFADGVYTIEGGNTWGISRHLDKFLNRTGLKKDDKHIIDDLHMEFKDWLCASPEYREQAEDLYNRSFRGFKEREFSNEPMDVPGLAQLGVKDYQWGGLRWCLNVGKGIIADDVGLGKTLKGLILARLMKTTGQAKRPMIVVPKSVLANWEAEAEKWFPGSKVLSIGGAKDTPSERKRKYHDMQQNDYDFILISEPSFEELDLDPTKKGEYNSKDFWVQRGDKLGNAGDKRQNAIKTAWNQARAGQEFNEKDRTDATYFNDMGVDALIYDEAHHTKNLAGIKSRFGESPKFLGGGGQSMRSLDFNLKSRWLLDQNSGKNVFLMTATPTKNSPIEIFSMISHVAPEVFEKIGIRNSEEFLDRFAKFEDAMAMTTSGNLEEALITAGFQNMDELRGIMKQVIRRKTAADVGLKLPERQDVQHMIDMDDAQQAAYAELRELAANAGGKDATGDAHIFSVMDKMNKAATDMSLLDPSYDATKAPKYVACAKEIMANVKDGGQIVFSDYVDSHEKIAAALVASGIPRNQIGIINAQAAPSSANRQKICDAFNAGKLNVVIGNTTVMGEGLNLQKGTSDIHHLDLPWEPASMQQRNGRGLRQGNTNKGVRIHSYLTKGSFDGYRLQTIMAKKDWQDAVWNGGNEVENLNKKGVDRDELFIMLAADPDQARAAFDANHAAKEERLTAGKTTEAAQRFVKFQEVKRSYTKLKNKDNQSAMRLKVKMDKEYSALRADRYFTSKEALDMDAVIVANTGVLLHSGAGVELSEGTKSGKWVVTGVDPRKGEVAMRRYGDETGKDKRVMDFKDLPNPKAFAFSEATETEEINRKIADRPIEIKSMKDLQGIPPAVLAANQAKIQAQIWDGTKKYSIHHGGDVPMIEKATGKLVRLKEYGLAGKEETHDFLLPTEENKAKVLQAWMQAERGATFSTETTTARRGGKSTTRPKRNYGGYSETMNPWGQELHAASGGIGHYYAGSDVDTTPIRAARAQLHAEQLARIKKADGFTAALNEATPLGEIVGSDGEYRSHVKYPKRVLAMLWAKARHEGVLDAPIDNFAPKAPIHGSAKLYNKHSGYAWSGASGSVHGALLKMAGKAGHDDLVHAMIESGLRHNPDLNHDEALQAISNSQFIGNSEHKLRAFQKLAEASGLADKTRGEAGAAYGDMGFSSYYRDAGSNQTIRDHVAMKLAEIEARKNKQEAENV